MACGVTMATGLQMKRMPWSSKRTLTIENAVGIFIIYDAVLIISHNEFGVVGWFGQK